MEGIMAMIAEIQKDVEEIRSTFINSATKEVKNHLDTAGLGEHADVFLTAFCTSSGIDCGDSIEETVKNIMIAGRTYELHEYIDVFSRRRWW